METFGVGRSALEAVAPDNFAGMSIEWTAEGGRWVMRSNSSPALFPSSTPPAKKVQPPVQSARVFSMHLFHASTDWHAGTRHEWDSSTDSSVISVPTVKSCLGKPKSSL